MQREAGSPPGGSSNSASGGSGTTSTGALPVQSSDHCTAASATPLSCLLPRPLTCLRRRVVHGAGLVLLLAKLCLHLEGTVVPHVVEVLAAGAFQGGRGRRAGDTPPQFVGGEAARRLGSAARKGLAECTSLLGGCVSTVAVWMQHAACLITLSHAMLLPVTLPLQRRC